MSSLDLHVWVSRGEAVDCWIDNLYGGSSLFYAKLRCREETRILALEPSRRLHFTRRPYPEGAEGFVVMLRRLARDRRIVGVSQLGFDRVAVLELTGGYRLYIELLPRGVAVLVDDAGVVKALSRSLKTRDRELAVGREYTPPPLQQLNPFLLDAERLLKAVRGGRDLVRGLVRGLGLPGEAAEEAVYRSGVSAELSPAALSSSDAERVVRALSEIYGESLQGRGYLILDERGSPREASPFKPLRAPPERVVALETLDEALDELFSAKLVEPLSVSEEVSAERARLEASLEEARARAELYLEEARRLEEAAERLASSYELAESIVECVSRLWRARAARECSGVVAVDYSRGVYSFEIQGFRYDARYGETPQSIITRLYKEAGEARARAEKALEASAEIESRLRELETKARVRAIQARARARSVFWFEKYRWSVTTSGLLVLAGRDASQNESLVRKHLEDSDIFMHADIQGAPAVVIKTRGAEVRREDVEDAAVIAACYSKAWKAGLALIDVFWVRGSQVSKSPPPGEYLRRGSFMVYGRREYVKTELALAIGVALDPGGAPLVLAGSERVVSKHSIAYAIIVPGRRSLEEAELLRKALAEAVDEQDRVYVLAVREQELKDKIPGAFSILKVSRGGREVFDPRLYA